jgi:hypothetical protein
MIAAAPPATINRLTFQLNAQAVVGSSALIYLWDWNVSQWVHVRSFSLDGGSASTVKEFEVAQPYTRWINGSGEINAAVRVVTPQRIHTPFVLQIDRIQILQRVPAP